MRIGIDCRTILNPKAGEKAGIAHYTYHLVKSLLALDKIDEFILFFDWRAKNIIRDFLEPNTVIRYFTFSQYKKYLPFVYSHILSASCLDSEKLDLYHSPANIAPFRYSGKFLVTVHDLAIYRDPSLFPSRQGFSIKYLVPRTINRAKKVIAVSQSTKRDVETFFKVPSEKISVIYEGVDHKRFRVFENQKEISEHLNRTYKINRKFLLFVGTLEPRKNLIRLTEAVYQLVCRRPDIAKNYQLVLAGSPGWFYKEIFEQIKNRNLSEMVILPGYLPAKDLPKLYAGATAFVFPSLYEGFGLPVLEAMASGVPVITSNTSSLPEITKDSALLVDPYDTLGLGEAIEKLVDDEEMRQSLSAKGLRRASEFSWEKCAKETLALYKSIT